MGDVKLNSSGGGSVTLTTPSTASNLTVTLPSASGTLATTSGTGSVFTNPTINGFTGDTSVVNIGSGQFYKDTSGNVGIGTSSPANKLHVYGDGSASLLKVQASNTNGTASINLVPNGTGNGQIYTETGALLFSPASTERMRLDSSGNLGLGVTPSGSQLPTLQFGSNAIIASSANTYLTANAYYNSGWKYVASSQPAKMFSQDSSGFIWHTAPSGTAGNAISFTQAMTLTNGGILQIPNAYATTTAAAANLFIDAAGGFYRSTSALKYKRDIRDLESIDINKFRPVRYKSKSEKDDQEKDYFGLIADEVLEAGFPELVFLGADGEPEGFQYERLTAVLVKAIQELSAKNSELESRLAALEGK